MSKARYLWWGYARGVVRVFPDRQRELDQLKTQSLTVNLDRLPVCGGGGVRRNTETAAISTLCPDHQRELEAVADALEATEPEHRELIRLVYWAHCPLTLYGAAMRLHISERTALRWHKIFLLRVGRGLGFHPEVGTPCISA